METFYSRYIRHIILSDIGLVGQDILGKSKVLCIGAGGLGSPALMYLAATGVGSIGIVDFDVVNLSNLNRQVIFSYDDIGKNKAICAKNYIVKLNNSIDVSVYDYKLSYSNCFDLFKDYDVILDCTDNLESKFLINDFSIKLNIPLVHGSVFGLEGYVAVFLKGFSCYRCLYRDVNSLECINHGIIGPVTGIIGSLQALISIVLLLRRKNKDFSCDLFFSLFLFDFKFFKFRSLNVKSLYKCNFCL